ncbi:MAG: APC family permease [Treponema sp.]|jgi:amino acid transporter|nr:APC family permease [Treponema sp.]
MKTERKLGLLSAIFVCVGLIVASSCLLSLGQGMGLAGRWFVLSIFIVSVLNFFVTLSFSELHSLMPNIEGGVGQYTKVGMGPVVSMISNGCAYIVVNLLAPSVELAMCGMVTHEVFLPMIPAPVISIGFTLILTAVNYLGIDIFSKVQNFAVALLILSLAALGLISFFNLGTGQVISNIPQTPPPLASFGGGLSLAALAFWLFIGVEFVIPISKSLKNPKRDVPLSMMLGVLMLFVIQSILGTGMTHYVSYEELASVELPHMLFAERLLGQPGLIWMGIITILAGVSTANTVMSSIPRIISGMARNDMAPAFFMKKNRFQVPVAGLVMVTASILLLVGTGFTQSSGLVNILLAASCFWLTSYILVSMTVLILRQRYPDHPGRNKKLIFGGIPQILCILGDLFMIWNIAEGPARIFIYQLFLVILGVMIVFSVVWVKFIKKQPLFKGAAIQDVVANEDDWIEESA